MIWIQWQTPYCLCSASRILHWTDLHLWLKCYSHKKRKSLLNLNLEWRITYSYRLRSLFDSIFLPHSNLKYFQMCYLDTISQMLNLYICCAVDFYWYLWIACTWFDLVVSQLCTENRRSSYRNIRISAYWTYFKKLMRLIIVVFSKQI